MACSTPIFGWMLGGGALADPERYAKDLLEDPLARFVGRRSLVWLVAGLVVPLALGAALTGTVPGVSGSLN